jgi:Cu(I)/Ag(I) efflux system membrane fusion protein
LEEKKVMQRVRIAPFWLAVSLFAGIVGCGPATNDQASSPPPAEAGQGGDADHDHAMSEAAEPSMEEMMSGLKELSAEDYKSAMEQHVCPVSGEMLGSMGAPLKVDVNGTNVWICCDGCRDKLLADPEKYLTMLGQKEAGQTEASQPVAE